MKQMDLLPMLVQVRQDNDVTSFSQENRSTEYWILSLCSEELLFFDCACISMFFHTHPF